MKPLIKFVYFDVGGTILTVRPSVGTIYSEAMARIGFDVSVERIEEQFKRAWKAGAQRRLDSGFVCDDAGLKEEWRTIVSESFSGLAPEGAIDSVFENLYERFSHVDSWRVAESAIETFESLEAQGIRLGVFSNWDSRLPGTLEALGLNSYFDVQVISYEVGFEKPHPKIFERAIELAGVEPKEILFIGDSYHCDIEPAKQHGIHSLWVQDGPLHEDEPSFTDQGPLSLPVPTFKEVYQEIENSFRLK